MNKKWIGRIFIASVVVLILNAFALVIYYSVIKKDHEGPMEPWAIPLLIIPFGLEDYYISLDAGEQFVRIEESDLGTSYARESLKQKLDEYKNAHPVDKQRGDAIPPIREVVEFLNSVLD